MDPLIEPGERALAYALFVTDPHIVALAGLATKGTTVIPDSVYHELWEQAPDPNAPGYRVFILARERAIALEEVLTAEGFAVFRR
jgi:hypothetical protein